MRHGRPRASAGDRTLAHQEGSLTDARFVGSFPTADFTLPRPLPLVAFAGRSNVGKSSLINALVGRRELARTSKQPGKTRAANIYDVGGAYYLVDLPGYGYARVSQSERRSFLTLVRGLLGRGDLAGVVWLLDIRHPPSRDDLSMADALAEAGTPVLVAVTKADKLGATTREQRASEVALAVGVPADQFVVTSSQSRQGLTDLTESIAALLAER